MNDYPKYSIIETNGLTPLTTTGDFLLTHSTTNRKIGWKYLFFDNTDNAYEIHIKLNFGESNETNWLTVYANDFLTIEDFLIHNIFIKEAGDFKYILMR